jgi:hypothetical protein
MKEIVEIRANAIETPPAWAVMQRQLMDYMEQATLLATQKYSRADGTPYWVDDADDSYEAHSYRGLFYAVGASDAIGDISVRQWNAITRVYDDATLRNPDDPVNPKLKVQLHNEYYNAFTDTPADWFHMGEGNQSFYDFGLSDPTNPEHRRRARRFAAMYMGEDPEAPNYDAEHKIIRSPFHGSTGPLFDADAEFVKRALDPVYYPGGVARGHAQRSNLYPIIKELEDNWFEDDKRREEIVALFEKIVLNGDIPDNLACTALITNAYLYTGEDKYRNWVLEYTEAWMERVRQNDGIIPDNVGPTGKIGEHRDGQWWGGWYGWNSRNSARNAFLAATIASECCLLLTGDSGYLDLIRSQIELLLNEAKTRDDGQLVVPTRMMPDGWDDWQPLHINWLGRLYHASQEQRDYDMIARLRDGERESDWNTVESASDRSGGDLEARFQYYDGKFPDWPLKRLQAEYQYVAAMYEHMRQDDRDVETIIAEGRWPPNPVVTKGLVQVTMGSPQPVYNGGLLRGMVRYFDQEQHKPGLPQDVAALVDEVAADKVGVQLVNLSANKARTVIVQAGAYGEHSFTQAHWREQDHEALKRHAGLWLREEIKHVEKTVSVDGKHISVHLPPGTSIRLDLGVKRFAQSPSYAQPWHGGELKIY